MLLEGVALVAETAQITPRELMRVAAALEKQAVRDFGPIWDVRTTVSAFGDLDDVPLGYWPMVVRDDIGVSGAAGIHLDQDGQPFALIEYSGNWSLTASHECLEMLADPFGNRLMAGPSIKPDQGRVEYLVEVSDPSESEAFSYTVNDVMVSDFYTPHFFDPVAAVGVRYSFTGAITSPRQVLRGGYLSWHEPVTDHWWQSRFFGAQPTFTDLGPLARSTESLRSAIDHITPRPDWSRGLPADNPLFAAAAVKREAGDASSSAKAAAWRAQMTRLMGQ